MSRDIAQWNSIRTIVGCVRARNKHVERQGKNLLECTHTRNGRHHSVRVKAWLKFFIVKTGRNCTAFSETNDTCKAYKHAPNMKRGQTLTSQHISMHELNSEAISLIRSLNVQKRVSTLIRNNLYLHWMHNYNILALDATTNRKHWQITRRRHVLAYSSKHVCTY